MHGQQNIKKKKVECPAVLQIVILS